MRQSFEQVTMLQTLKIDQSKCQPLRKTSLWSMSNFKTRNCSMEKVDNVACTEYDQAAKVQKAKQMHCAGQIAVVIPPVDSKVGSESDNQCSCRPSSIGSTPHFMQSSALAAFNLCKKRHSCSRWVHWYSQACQAQSNIIPCSAVCISFDDIQCWQHCQCIHMEVCFLTQPKYTRILLVMIDTLNSHLEKMQNWWVMLWQ